MYTSQFTTYSLQFTDLYFVAVLLVIYSKKETLRNIVNDVVAKSNLILDLLLYNRMFGLSMEMASVI